MTGLSVTELAMQRFIAPGSTVESNGIQRELLAARQVVLVKCAKDDVCYRKPRGQRDASWKAVHMFLFSRFDLPMHFGGGICRGGLRAKGQRTLLD